jgi:hypothetical protein
MNPGHFVPLAGADVIGQATFEGCLAVVDVARRAFEETIPPSIRLPGRSAGSVRCLVLFGEQTAATTCFAGVPMPWGIRYHELMIAVPFVQQAARPGEHLYVHRMVCDYWPAVWVGNRYYGFGKRFARMTWDGERFVATDTSHGIQSAAALPVVGHRGDGTLISSRFEWDFRAAVVDVARADLTLNPGLLDLHGDDQKRAEAAYSVQRMRWRLSWPERAPV